MTLGAPEPLLARHRLDDFDCGKPALNDWLIQCPASRVQRVRQNLRDR